MYRLYKKNELSFSLVWIIAYVVSFSLADSISASLGILKIITAPVCIIFTLLILGFIKKHSFREQYGLCSFKGDLKKYLYFIPLILITSVNLWNGITMNASIAETALFILSMACVGVIEEVIFRGFLFKAMCKDNIKFSVFISSITFGMGHIVNLLNGKDLIPTLLQIWDVVAKGDVLISGTVTMEPPKYSGRPNRYYQTHARGRVWARTWRFLTAAIPVETAVKEYTGAEKSVWSLNFLGRRVKIFGNV